MNEGKNIENQTLKEIHQNFVQDLKEKNSARSTVLAYGKDIEQLLNFAEKKVGKLKVDQITKKDLEDFMKNLEERGFTPKTISRKLNSTKTFFRYLKLNDLVIDDPATLIPHPKFETPPPRILTETEYRALRDASRSDIRTRAIVEILLQTGIRIGELSGIKMEDFSIDEGKNSGELKIPDSRVTLGRTIPLNEAAVEAIQEYLKIRPDAENQRLLITRNGKPLAIRNIRAAVKKYMRKAQIKEASVNDLRHTWIAHHIKKGANLVLISKLAGHKRIATTERYLKFIDTKDKNSKLETL